MAVSASFLFISPDASALWGKSKTKIEDGDADLGLGEYTGLKHAVGVKGFDNEAGWHGEWHLGNNLGAMLESALYDSGRFVIVEREQLGAVLAEQDLATSGRAAKAKKAAQTGKVRLAKYLATGSITEVDTTESGGDGGLRIKGVRLGLGKQKAQVTIIAKLIDTTTGEIVAKKRLVGSPSGTKVRVGYAGRDVGVDLGGFKKTPLGQAAQEAVNLAAAFFAREMEEFPFEGSVVKVTSSGEVIINRGSQFGMEEGQALVISTAGEQLIDPDTGEILDEEEGEVTGRLRVTRVKEKISYCEIVEGDQPERGAIVQAE